MLTKKRTANHGLGNETGAKQLRGDLDDLLALNADESNSQSSESEYQCSNVSEGEESSSAISIPHSLSDSHGNLSGLETDLLQSHKFILHLSRALHNAKHQNLELYQNSVVFIAGRFKEYRYETPWSGATESGGSGSGFILEYKGHRFVLTNAHVANDARLTIRFSDQARNFSAKALHIDSDCDLAILDILDEKFWEIAKPFQLGSMPKLRDSVTRVGFPMGGNEVCIEIGNITRIEVSEYSVSGAELLQMQVSAHQNPGNSGGPVINEDGKVVGVSFQSWRGAGLHYSIPVPVIQHFLDDFIHSLDSGTEYKGFPDLGFYFQRLENKVLREALKLTEPEHGVLIRKVHPLCASNGILKEGDVLVAIDGFNIKYDGTIQADFMSRVNFTYLITRKNIGDTITAKVIRAGQELDLTIELRYRAKTTTLVSAREYNKPPTYYIVCGVVLTPATENSLDEIDLEEGDEDLGGLEANLKKKPGQEIVMVNNVLTNDYTEKAFDMSAEIVTHINEQEVSNLRHAIEIIEACKDPIIMLKANSKHIMALKNISKDEHLKLLEKHQIYRDRSDDLLKPPVYKPGCPEYELQQKESLLARSNSPSRMLM